MIIKPKVRGFLCITAHPKGCASYVKQQIKYVQDKGLIKNGPKNVLIIGASTGYGLASRITAAFGFNANTIGVFLERPAKNGRTASAGWYNTVAFEKAALKAGLYAKSINGDSFSYDTKKTTLDMISKDIGPIDLIIYSLAAPRRIDYMTGLSYQSILKPVNQSFKSKTLNTDKEIIHEIQLQSASQKEINDTVKVMGGEDWELWINLLQKANLINSKAITIAYSYIGPELTYPIYLNGTIGKAKKDLELSAKRIDEQLSSKLKGRAFVSINKAVVTQASSAIPVVPLYLSVLMKVMKERKMHEDCIQQIYRLFNNEIYNTKK